MRDFLKLGWVFLFVLVGCSDVALGQNTDLCEGFRTDNEQVSIPVVPKPEPLASFRDPVFGSLVTRVSDAPAGGVVKPLYNTVQAWNADESLLLLYHAGAGGSGHHLYDGESYAYLRQLDIVPADIEEVFWDAGDADVFYFVSKASATSGSLIRYHVSTDTQEVVRDFSDVCAGGYAGGGNDVQMMSVDADVIGLRCKEATSANPVDKTFYYRISTDTVSDVLMIGGGTPYEPWYALQVANSGERFLLGADVLDEDLNVVRSLDVTMRTDGFYKPEHAVFGQFANGHDAFFSVIYDPVVNGCDGGASQGVGSLTAYDMETGACRVLIGEANGYGYPLSGVHPSSLSYKNPGWVAMSSIGYGLFDYFENNEPAPVLTSEIYLVNANDENPEVCRLAHARTLGKSAESGEYAGYFGEPHVVISPSGTRILFGSDWYDSGSVDTYVIDLRAGHE